jgi:hypothetical protein
MLRKTSADTASDKNGSMSGEAGEMRKVKRQKLESEGNSRNRHSRERI